MTPGAASLALAGLRDRVRGGDLMDDAVGASLAMRSLGGLEAHAFAALLVSLAVVAAVVVVVVAAVVVGLAALAPPSERARRRTARREVTR